MDVSYITIPEGYTASYLPENNEYSSERFSYQLRYTPEGNQIRVEQHIYLNFLLLNPNEFEDWNAMIKQMSRAFQEIIIFKAQ